MDQVVEVPHWLLGTIQRKAERRVTLLDGPDPATIVPEVKLAFKGLSGEEFFCFIIRIVRVIPGEGVEKFFGREAMPCVGDVYFLGEIQQEGFLNANGATGMFVSYLPHDVRGLWRKSGDRVLQFLPRGNGFLDFLY